MKAILSLTVALFLILPPGRAAEAAYLRGQVTVEGEMIRLGDLFAEAGKRAEMVVAAAPAPGRRAVFGAEELRTIARRGGISWRPASRYERITVDRSSRLVVTGDIRDRIRAALKKMGLPPSHRIALSKPDLVLRAATDPSRPVKLVNPRMNLRAGRFAVVFEVPTGATSADRVPVTGELFEIAEVPVLSRRMRRDEVIRRHDLTTIELRRDAIARDAIVDAGRIVGLTPKRLLRDGVPLRPGDLRPPILVVKGSLITLTLRTDRMVMTARGKALDNGARGETVRVVNPRSRNTVEGVVAGPGQVTVAAPASAR